MQYEPHRVTVEVTLPGTPLTREQVAQLKAALAETVVSTIGMESLKSRDIRVITATVFDDDVAHESGDFGQKRE